MWARYGVCAQWMRVVFYACFLDIYTVRSKVRWINLTERTKTTVISIFCWEACVRNAFLNTFWHGIIQFGHHSEFGALGVLFQMSQTAPLWSANSISYSVAEFHKSPNIFNGVQIRTPRWPRAHIGCHYEFSSHLWYGSDELEHCRQPACIPIPGKTVLLLHPKYGYSPTSCILRVRWLGAPSHRNQMHPKSEATDDCWTMTRYSEGWVFNSDFCGPKPNHRCVFWICTHL